MQPIEYECDSKDLTDIFIKSEYSKMEKWIYVFNSSLPHCLTSFKWSGGCRSGCLNTVTLTLLFCLEVVAIRTTSAVDELTALATVCVIEPFVGVVKAVGGTSLLGQTADIWREGNSWMDQFTLEGVGVMFKSQSPNTY